MEVTKYVNQMKELYNIFIEYIDTDSKEDEIKFYENLLNYIKNQRIQKNKEEIENILEIIINIANNHHRTSSFFGRLEQILKFFQDEIKQSFSNFEIFNLFESNKRLLLFFIKEGILNIDENIYKLIENKREPNGNKYSDYFIPEIHKNNENENEENIYLNEYLEYPNEFEYKRNQGENDSYVCNLIRQDLVEDFVSFVNRTNFSFSNEISPSIFETNSFLNSHNPNLIEYAAFFGSIQIYQYLYINKVDVDCSLWFCGIHSNNSNLIRHYIENQIVEPDEKTSKNILIESIKCHHNEIADYINTNLIKGINQSNISVEINDFFLTALKYRNYYFIENDLNKDQIFYLLCHYNYKNIVNIILDEKRDYFQSIIKKNDVQKVFFLKDAKDFQTETIYYLLLKETEIKKEYFKGNANLKLIAFPPSITSIEERSFENCASLEFVTFSPSIKSIENNMFFNCTSLTQITIPYSVTSIGKCAFYKCSSLREVIIPCSVTKIGDNSFTECESLSQILIPSSVTEIGAVAFSGCYSLTEIEIPVSVTTIEDFLFERCHHLTQVIVHDKIKTINNHAFNCCFELKKFTIPPFVTSIGIGAFSGCSSLTQMEIPDSVQRINAYTFEGCSSLIQIKLPSCLTYIGSFAFNNCYSLSQINIPSSITYIGKNAFCRCQPAIVALIPPSLVEQKNEDSDSEKKCFIS